MSTDSLFVVFDEEESFGAIVFLLAVGCGWIDFF